ncbi:MAG: sodium:proton antiporter NhaD, partial [Bacteroidota bacterium]|nr:sodium:proton antiporter NhaD [Bacteroidota bacterium]
VLFFLMGAMTIVELIDSHDGFEIIASRIKTTSKKKLVVIIGLLAFFFSAVLDNLTTTIVMISLTRKLTADKHDRWMLAGLIIIAANAGGAWSPIGDVTTTMLWIGNQVTTTNIILHLLVPGLACAFVPLLLMRYFLRGNITGSSQPFNNAEPAPGATGQRNIIFFSGIIILLMVPVFKTVTHLPPFMAILMGLGIMWIITEIIHSGKDEEDRKNYTVAYALRKIDTPSILFFLGILLAISALESVGQLAHASAWMNKNLENHNVIVMFMGLLSSVIDNVPLVAASQGMYAYPTDHYFWEFLAYCTGTGGSILIIGSAAGVAAMGIEKIDFMWYLKRVSWLALLGYFAGAVVYMLQERVIGG